MKDELIAKVANRTGLDQAKAEQAVDAVLDFLKENPGELKELIGVDAGGESLRDRGKEALEDARERVGPVAEKGKEAIGEARERIAPVAAAAGEKIGDVGSKVSGRLRGLFKKDGPDDEAAPAPAATADSEAER